MLNRREERKEDIDVLDKMDDGNRVSDMEALIKTMWNLEVDVKIPRVELGRSVFLDKLQMRLSEYFNDD
tara:strand:+ start:159 stop:365 length:207 start_codon:yes stop_codon:yes gene_type:complete